MAGNETRGEAIVRRILNTRRENTEAGTWICYHERSHGVCNTVNADDETSCGACGEDRPEVHP